MTSHCFPSKFFLSYFLIRLFLSSRQSKQTVFMILTFNLKHAKTLFFRTICSCVIQWKVYFITKEQQEQGGAIKIIVQGNICCLTL